MRTLLAYALAGAASYLAAAPAFAVPSVASTLTQCLRPYEDVERVHQEVIRLGWMTLDQIAPEGTRNPDGLFVPDADFENAFVAHYHAFWFRLHAFYDHENGLNSALERSYDKHPQAGYLIDFQSNGLRNIFFSDTEMTFALYVLSHAGRPGKSGHGCLVVGAELEEDLAQVFAGQREIETDVSPYQLEKRFFQDAGKMSVSDHTIFARWGGNFVHWDSAKLAEETQNRVALGVSTLAHITWETPVE